MGRLKLLRAEIPYEPDSGARFAMWAGRPWSVFLDSGYPGCGQGRYDLLAAEPYATLVTRGPVTEIRIDGRVERSGEDPFHLLRRMLDPQAAETSAGLPFQGGAIGYFAYDLGRRLEQLPTLAEDAEQIPEMMVGLYDWALVADHQARRSTLVSSGRRPETLCRWSELVARCRESAPAPASGFRLLEVPRANLDFERYSDAFHRLQRYIRDGDCYQVNLAMRFAARAEGDPYALYRALRARNPAPFAAYLDLPGVQVVSSSPERFLRVQDGWVETKPIKGTRRRGLTPAEDFAQIEALQTSVKDRAENLMIVDLLRNDLGKTCAPGTISVPKLFGIESYATVHHLVSTVRGRLAPEQHALDLLRGCFPGGSITGAPKVRAMEIIEELEPHRRGVYCGSIGYIGYDGGMDTNIAIRTLVHSNGVLRLWAGGGIVADSHLASEYQECYHKARAMLEVLEALRSA